MTEASRSQFSYWGKYVETAVQCALLSDPVESVIDTVNDIEPAKVEQTDEPQLDKVKTTEEPDTTPKAA